MLWAPIAALSLVASSVAFTSGSDNEAAPVTGHDAPAGDARAEKPGPARPRADDRPRPGLVSLRPVAPAASAVPPPTETDERAPGSGDPAPGVPGPTVNPPPPRPDRAAPAPAPEPAPPSDPHHAAVHPGDFPDPQVVHANGSYWAFATQVGMTAVPTLRSSDLIHWEFVGDALHRTPSWSEWGHHWAPAVLPRGSVFVLFYVTRHRASGLQCLSRAVSVLPQGPYVDESDGPLVCQMARGGSIDPSPFVDADGRAWLLWKSEGTLQGEPTRLWVQRLSDDGQHLVGERTELLQRALPWEFPIIEAPSMVLVDGRYHLFYSGNRWETADYAVGHAVCASVVGPCRRTSTGPVLATRPGAAGPGGQEVVRTQGGEHVLVHHAWDPSAVGYPHGARRLHVTSLTFHGDHVGIGSPWRGDGGQRGLVDDVTPGPIGTGATATDPRGRAPLGRIAGPH